MTTNPDLDQAREVADTIAQSPKAYDSGIQAVARVIASLPDEWVDADKVRKVLEEARLLIRDGEPEIILNDLIALLATANHVEKERTMSEQGVTLNEQDAKDLVSIHREAEAHWEQVWDTARECGHTEGMARAGKYLAGHKWAIYVLTGGLP